MDRTFFIIQSLWLELVMPDDTTKEFYLEAPNGKTDAFTWGFRIIPVQNDFQNPSFDLVKGFKKFRHIANFTYDWHTMPFHLLLTAKTIKLKHPPGFKSVDHYLEVDCILENEEALKTYQNSLSGAMASADTEYDANRIKSGPVTLRFLGKKALTWSEVNEIYFNQKIESTDITGDSTEITGDSIEIILHD